MASLPTQGPRPGIDYKRERTDVFWGNRPLWLAILLAAFTVLSAAKPVVLHDGGAATYFSLLFLWLVSHFYGPRLGACAGVAFGLARFVVTLLTGEYINYAPGAILLEYPLACASFALGSVFTAWLSRRRPLSEPWRLRIGYLVGVCMMGVCYVASAVLFYPPDRVGFFANLVYCIAYDMSYLLMEASITLVLLFIPAVVDALGFLKVVATTKRKDTSLDRF